MALTSLAGEQNLAWARVKRSGADTFNKFMVGVQALPIFVIKLTDENLFLHKVKSGAVLGGIKGLEDMFFELKLSDLTVKKKIYIMGYGFNFVFNRFRLTSSDGTTIELHVPKSVKRFVKNFIKANIAVSQDGIKELTEKLKSMRK